MAVTWKKLYYDGDRLLAPMMAPQSVPAGETLAVPAGHSFVVAGDYTVPATSSLVVTGDMVILT